MKKYLSVVSLSFCLVCLFTSCAKERDARDNALCNHAWALNSASTSYVLSENITANTSLGINGTTTSDSSTEFFGHELTSTKIFTNQPESGAAAWDKVVSLYGYSMVIVFYRDGHYQMHLTQALHKVTHSTNAAQDPDFYVEGESSVSDYSGAWHWLNNTDSKRAIYLEQMGTYDIQVDENLLTLRKVQDTQSSSTSFFASNTILKTDRMQMIEFLHFSPQ